MTGQRRSDPVPREEQEHDPHQREGLAEGRPELAPRDGGRSFPFVPRLERRGPPSTGAIARPSARGTGTSMLISFSEILLGELDPPTTRDLGV